MAQMEEAKPDDVLDNFLRNCPDVTVVFPKVTLTMANEPLESHRVRYRSEMADFAARGSKSTCGSRLCGRGDDDGRKNVHHVTVSLSTNVTVSGRLLGLPVYGDGKSPARIHLFDLMGDGCEGGVFTKLLQLTPGSAASVMLTKVGIVRCAEKSSTAKRDTKAMQICNLFSDPKTHGLFGTDGCLAVDPMDSVGATSALTILFVFVPDAEDVPVARVFTRPTECTSGSAGGKSGLRVKAVNPMCVYLNIDSSLPSEDVWLQLDCAIKVKTEQLVAELVLPRVPPQGCEDQPPPDEHGPIQLVTEVDLHLVKLKLTSLTAEQFPVAGLPQGKFEATVRLTKLTQRPDDPAGDKASEETVQVYFDYLTLPCLSSDDLAAYGIFDDDHGGDGGSRQARKRRRLSGSGAVFGGGGSATSDAASVG